MGDSLGIQNFNIVLVGENFPVSNVVVSDFKFRHREMKEKLRAPVVLQAEVRGAELNIFSERFEASVIEPLTIDKDARDLAEMANQFFEYVGPKAVNAVGHNLQYVLEGSEGHRWTVLDSILRTDRIAELIGGSLQAADVNLFTKRDETSVTRVGILGSPTTKVVLDFNINYDRSDISARDAAAKLPESIVATLELAEKLESELLREAQ